MIQIRVGYELTYQFPQPTPLIVTLNIHHSRASDLLRVDHLITRPSTAMAAYRDGFGNWCTRLVAPAGQLTLTADALVQDTGLLETPVPDARQHDVQILPAEALVFLLGSRYCETDCLSDIAWQLFSGTPPGWARVLASCDFVHQHITFGYEYADATKTALQAYQSGTGVCRDYAHLAIALCRCMNIPARYCTGYLGDIGVPPPHGPMDFAGWFEAYLGDAWHTFDARNNEPRIGRILIARGRDAADVAISTTFGANELEHFKVWAEEIV